DRAGRICLGKRPSTGIWAGLYSPPVFADAAALEADVQARWPRGGVQLEHQPAFLHVLTHRDLHLHAVVARVEAAEPAADDWYTRAQWSEMGLPAPVRKLLEREG
ncbi:NUDIX domain-containing protein, partial [Acidovorax cavernicola]